MFFKNLFFLTLLIILCQNVSSSVPKEVINKIENSYKNNDWNSIIFLLDSLEKNDMILNVANWVSTSHPALIATVFPYLSKRCDRNLLNLLHVHKNLIDQETMYFIIRPLYIENVACVDHDIIKYFVKYANDSNLSCKLNSVIASVVTKKGSLGDVNIVSNWLEKKHQDSIVEWPIFTAQARFKTARADSILNKGLARLIKTEYFENLLEFGIKEFNRYDFIANLQMLIVTLKPNSKQIAENIKLIDETIAYLEKKKLEKAPIGLPLDWPNGQVGK